jgi:AraC-like DNA-binding protein
MSIQLRSVTPGPPIDAFVQNFWMMENVSDRDIEATVLPDGMVDLFLVRVGAGPFRILLKGLDIEPSAIVVEARTKMFAVSCKLPAVEWLLQEAVADIVNIARVMPGGFWGFGEEDLEDFERWCGKAGAAVGALVGEVAHMDNRKKELFELIYSSNGSMTVKEISEKVFWSSRQISRYFNNQFGLSLKAYCGILRFRAAFEHIKAGKLFPEGGFFDQSHFIKEVKRLSGVLPKELRQNKNGRFLQFSVLGEE